MGQGSAGAPPLPGGSPLPGQPHQGAHSAGPAPAHCAPANLYNLQGHLKLDSKRRPRKEKFFKSSEFLPLYLLSSLSPRCANLTKLTFDRCVFGPGLKSSIFPDTLVSITFRSCFFVRKSSFFDAIWSNVPSLKELRIENILNFSKRDCYAVVTSLSIDFDIQFSSVDTSPSFIFYKSLDV